MAQQKGNTLEKTSTSRPKSQVIFDRMSKEVPGGANSPVRSYASLGICPMIAERGSADMIYDVDGNGYIDYCCSWGPLIHGHGHPKILEAARRQLDLGTTFGVTCVSEEKIARIVTGLIPSVEKIRFVSSGTEATMSAARLARGFTGRDVVVKFTGNYHGHADMFLVQAGSGVLGLTPTSTSAGIPKDMIKNTVCLDYNDIEGCRAFFSDPRNKERIAGVILEPIAGNIGCVPASHEFISMLREKTREIGALLIFDEVITGFRVGLGGAQEYFGIEADLTCFGKIIGGGFPAAAFGGRREIMDFLAPLGPVYQAGTLSGNPVAMEAGAAALELLMQDGFYEELERKTNVITEPVRELLEESGRDACLQQVGSLFTLFFGARKVGCMQDVQRLDKEAFASFFRYMFDNGVYIPPAQQEVWFVSMAHTESHLEETRDLMLSYLKR